MSKTNNEAGAASARPNYDAIIERWWAEHYPESGGLVPYLSGPWHHARAAKDDLKRRFAEGVTE